MSSLTLHLPNNYVELGREEIEYLEGGGFEQVCTPMSLDSRLISVPINALGWWFTGVGVAKATAKAAGMIASVLGTAKYADNIANVIGGFTGSWFELGTHLANYLDGLDGSKDGRIAYTNCTTVWK